MHVARPTECNIARVLNKFFAVRRVGRGGDDAQLTVMDETRNTKDI